MEFFWFIEQNILWILLGGVVITVFALAIRANMAFDKYVEMREKYLDVQSSLGLSAKELGAKLSNIHFSGIVKVETAKTDGADGTYIPKTQTVQIKAELLNSSSISAISVLAHEFGHAIQHFENPNILIKHQKLINFVKFLGNLNPLIVILSIVLGITMGYVYALVGLGTLLIGTTVAICLKAQTSHVEKDASKQALKVLENFGYSEADLVSVKKFLNSAKNTYTADFLCALLGWTGLTRKAKYF